ncbi:MAG: RING finger protein [Planctomycetota bacterium]
MERPSARLLPRGPGRCPYCHDALVEGAPSTTCGECRAPHHADCFQELGKCASCGQAALREFRPYRAPLPEETPIGQIAWRIALVLGGLVLLVAASARFPTFSVLLWACLGVAFMAVARWAKRGLE